MICPVAHSDIPTAPEGCIIELKSLEAKDVLKHWNAVMKESPEWLKNLHRNFVNHFSKLSGNVSDEKQKIIVAYRHYFTQSKHPMKRRRSEAQPFNSIDFQREQMLKAKEAAGRIRA